MPLVLDKELLSTISIMLMKWVLMGLLESFIRWTGYWKDKSFIRGLELLHTLSPTSRERVWLNSNSNIQGGLALHFSMWGGKYPMSWDFRQNWDRRMSILIPSCVYVCVCVPRSPEWRAHVRKELKLRAGKMESDDSTPGRPVWRAWDWLNRQ